MSRSKSQGVIVPVKVTTVRSTATANIHVSVPKINLRRSKMSPIEPAGSASRKNGKAEAVWINAIYNARLVSDGHEPSRAHRLHEVANVRDQIRDQQVAEKRDAKRAPRAYGGMGGALNGLGHSGLNLHQDRSKFMAMICGAVGELEGDRCGGDWRRENSNLGAATHTSNRRVRGC